MHQVWVESNPVGCMDECNMTIIIHLGLQCALTATSMTSMTSVTSILLVNLVSILVFPFSLNHIRYNDIKFVRRWFTWSGVYNFRMASPTIAQAPTNSHVSQFGHWNPELANTYQHKYTICLSTWYVNNIYYFAICSSGNAWVATISSPESDLCMVISKGRYMQG